MGVTCPSLAVGQAPITVHVPSCRTRARLDPAPSPLRWSGWSGSSASTSEPLVARRGPTVQGIPIAESGRLGSRLEGWARHGREAGGANLGVRDDVAVFAGARRASVSRSLSSIASVAAHVAARVEQQEGEEWLLTQINHPSSSTRAGGGNGDDRDPGHRFGRSELVSGSGSDEDTDGAQSSTRRSVVFGAVVTAASVFAVLASPRRWMTADADVARMETPTPPSPSPSSTGLDPAQSDFVKTLLERSRLNKAKYDKERLDDYYRRNYKDYFEFLEGSLRTKKDLSVNEQAILKWLDQNKR